MTPDEACNAVDRYIASAKEVMQRRMDLALREIAQLRPWQVGKARQIACKTLGIGPYWRCDGRPRTFVGFYAAYWWNDFLSWCRRLKFRWKNRRPL